MSDSKPGADERQPDGETGKGSGAEAKPGKRRKKRKKRGDRRPAFARSYPRSPELDRLLLAFEAGNYGLVRTEAAALAERSDDQALRDAALDLRRRIEPGPTAIYLWAIGVALLLFLFGYYLMQTHQ